MKNIAEWVYIAEGAKIIGDVTIGEDSSVWYNAVIRGDSNSIVIGENSNVQDNAVLHTSHSHALTIGDNVTIGHGAIVHGCYCFGWSSDRRQLYHWSGCACDTEQGNARRFACIGKSSKSGA